MRASKKKQRQSSLHLTDKRHPVAGVLAMFLGIISVISFVVLCFISSQSHGHAGMFVGFLGILCFILSLIGFVMSWITLRQENIRPVFPTIAAIINGLEVVFYFVLCILANLIS